MGYLKIYIVFLETEVFAIYAWYNLMMTQNKYNGLLLPCEIWVQQKCLMYF